MQVPFVDLKIQYETIKSEIDLAIQKIFEESTFIGGKPVWEFEQNFSGLLNGVNVVSVANGTDAIYILLKMLGIGYGDEVITTATSWISTSETISQTGAKPVFVDVDPDYYTIDVNQIERKINNHTKAIIPVHLYGQMADMASIKKLCEKHKLFLIEDCAQSHFSVDQGVFAGLHGMAGTFSFYPGKNLGAYGDAGCIITGDNELATKCRMYANHGALVKHEHKIEGINSRLDTIQAAVLNVKLKYLNKWNDTRIANAAIYDELLKEVSNIVRPKVRAGTKHTFHIYAIRAQNRDGLKRWLEEHGVNVAIHYPTALPNLQAYQYLRHPSDEFPVATRLQGEFLSLPMYPELTRTQIEYVVRKIDEFYTKEMRT